MAFSMIVLKMFLRKGLKDFSRPIDFGVRQDFSCCK